jgi:Chromate transporter
MVGAGAFAELLAGQQSHRGSGRHFFQQSCPGYLWRAYAVLPYVAQQAVQTHHWLSAGQMLDGLGLAETTPGPLITVTQFVGFLGGWNHPGQLPPLLAATLGALMTTWTTFTLAFSGSFWVAPTLKNCAALSLDHNAIRRHRGGRRRGAKSGRPCK